MSLAKGPQFTQVNATIVNNRKLHASTDAKTTSQLGIVTVNAESLFVTIAQASLLLGAMAVFAMTAIVVASTELWCQRSKWCA